MSKENKSRLSFIMAVLLGAASGWYYAEVKGRENLLLFYAHTLGYNAVKVNNVFSDIEKNNNLNLENERKYYNSVFLGTIGCAGTIRSSVDKASNEELEEFIKGLKIAIVEQLYRAWTVT